LLTWSDETYRIFGLPKGAPLNYDVFLSSIHPEDRSSVDARWQAALRGEPYDIEHRTVADGTVKWVREKAFLEFDEAGQLSGGFGIAQDISERKQAEEALRQAEERRVAAEAREAERARFNHVLDMLPAYVILLSPDYRIPFANRFFEERFGRSEGRCCYEYLFHRSEPCENCETYKVLKTGMPHRWEWTGPDSRNYDIYDFPFTDVNGSPLIMEVGLDITEQKKAAAALKESNENLERRVVERTEELRKAKEAAEAANTAKSQFLANMSHELRTPMNAILGMIDVALPKADDPVVDDCLRTAKGSADLLLALLNDLLDSAKIESGRLELESAPFSLRHVLDQLSRVLSIRASEKGLTFSCRVPPDSPDVVVGDRMRLQQILLNLGGNAIKFTERGEVEVSLDAVVNDGETTLQFTVRDTGIGIPPAGLVRLFQPFAQADASTTRRFGGTGLGLSICKNLVEAMGGRIWVESEVGKGSKFAFSVRLPLAAELPADFTAPTTVSPTAVAALRILLVEDNPANQKLAKYILEDRGHVVEIAANGREAIDLTETNCYHAILMDVQMPGMNGLEATAAIREREKDGRRTPIVAMTAHAMRGDRERFLGAGMDGYLAKPIDARDLIGLVESLASQGDPKPGCSTSRPCTAGRVPPDEPAIFNAHRALESCFDNEEMLRQMIDCFFADEATLLPAMRQAQEKHDLDAVGRLAHRVRGTLAYLAAPKAFEDAHRIECLCSRGSDATEIRREIDLLEHECAALRVALREYLQSTNER
jgi:two-component system CheB/CheR fusion protein